MIASRRLGDRGSRIGSYLAVLANATVTGTDVAAVLFRERKSVRRLVDGPLLQKNRHFVSLIGHTLRVLENRVGILSCGWLW